MCLVVILPEDNVETIKNCLLQTILELMIRRIDIKMLKTCKKKSGESPKSISPTRKQRTLTL